MLINYSNLIKVRNPDNVNIIKMINDEFLTEIQSKIRNKILKKYPKRIRKIDLSDESRFDDSDENQEENVEVED